MAFSLRKPKDDDNQALSVEETKQRFSLGGRKKGGADSHIGPIEVGVVLLPSRYADARRARRVTQVSIITGTLALSTIALASALIWRHTQELQVERDVLQARVDTLNAQQAALKEFQDQANKLNKVNNDLKAVMSSEVSWARMLNDLSMTVPPTTTLEGFSATIIPEAAANVASTVDPSLVPSDSKSEDPNAEPKPPVSIGDISIEGYSIEKYSPGVETVLARFDEVLSYSDVFLSSTSKTQTEGVIAGQSASTNGEVAKSEFSTAIKIGPAALTGRYRDGLPETGE